MGIVFLSDRATTSTLIDSVAREGMAEMSTSRGPIYYRYMQADNPDRYRHVDHHRTGEL